MEENQIRPVGLLTVNIEGAERLLIASFEEISRVKDVAISCHDFYIIALAIRILKQKKPS
jgi:hypothetical protein